MNSKFDIIPVETDVLIIGGGLAGCMASIKARESDIRVTIAEKANTMHSGCAASGVDHVWAYIPPVHEKMGWTIEDLMEDHDQATARGLVDRDLLHLIARTMYDRVLDLESFGLKFRFEDSNIPGKFRVVYQFHSVPSSLNFEGRPIKVKLTQEAQKRKVLVVNRVMITDLLMSEGCVTGAVGVSTRKNEIYLFRTKTAVLCTGRVNRLGRNVTGIWGNRRVPPMSGEGKAMAFHSGIDIINMEFLSPERYQIGFYETAGGAPGNSWQPGFRLVDHKGDIIVPRGRSFDWENLEKMKINVSELRKGWLEKKRIHMPPSLEDLRKGSGPYYLDGREATREEIRYAEWSLSHEGKCNQFLEHLKEMGVDLTRDRIEIAPNNRELSGAAAAGVVVNRDLETNIKGLFAAGDEVGGVPWSSASGAIAMGWYAGEMAAKEALKMKSILPFERKEKLETLTETCLSIYENAKGYHWKEVETALENIMDYYCYNVRSASMLKRGLERLAELRQVSLSAMDLHELSRCLEVRSVLDNAEMVLRASLVREESRRVPKFQRSDFPEQDDEKWLVFSALKKKNGDVLFSKIPVKR